MVYKVDVEFFVDIAILRSWCFKRWFWKDLFDVKIKDAV